ncbi:hypothetical protein H0H87_012280 [Tephrocybe sp. NHM501043]|nr:hypothetical protein H0H87_012280 [Tephrocybe sp. NHM501043]
MAASPLRQLLNLLTESVHKLEAACDSSGCEIPDLYTPFSSQSEVFRANPEADEAAKIICAASAHIQAILMPPHISLFQIVSGHRVVIFQHSKSGALRVCLESNVTEILREAGPEGLHVDEIALKNGQDPQKLARFLRYLATHHVYREVTPNVFANTRISSMIDTLKPSQDVIANPETKHDGTNGFAALASLQLDEVFKASSYSWETLADPATVKSGDPKASPLTRVFKAGESFWDLQARDTSRGHRFNLAMRGIQTLQPVDAIIKAYDWDKLPESSTVVDVGGGVGSESIIIARNYPQLEIVIQDLPPVIEDATKLWKADMPTARVTFEVQDFFKPQQTNRDVAVFLVKQILHDWSDEYCVELLSHLRAAARDHTRLVLIESIIPYACHDLMTSDVEGAIFYEAPKPLLANYGAVNGLGYDLDFTMFALYNAQERTIHHIENLLGSSGWLVRAVRRHKSETTYLQSVEAVPIK